MAVERQRDARTRLYRLIFERSHEGIMFTTPDGTILAANPAACRLMGYEESEILALGRDGLLVHDERAARAFAERARTGVFVGELTWRKKGGKTFVADVSSELFVDEESGQQRSILILRDASPRHLAEQRMTTAARMEAMGQLSSGVAHDFNNLLQVIIPNAEALVDACRRDPQALKAATAALKASTRASDLTRQLLSFIRQQPIEPEFVRVADIVRETEHILSRAIGRNVAMDVAVAADEAVALVDPSQLQNAIVNIALNARDAMPDGGRLSISCKTRSFSDDSARSLDLAAGPYIVVAIEDEGTGIPQDILDRVVEPFFTTKPPGKGSGLGLSTAFGFARQSNGTLTIDSTVGTGTTVSLYLPARSETAGLGETPAATTTSPATVTESILVVEDNGLVAQSLSAMIELAGHRSTVCSSLSEAESLLQERPDITLVLTDLVLGAGSNGWQVVELVHGHDPDLPVILMTGFSEAGDEERAREAGIPILHKPFRIAALLGAIPRG